MNFPVVETELFDGRCHISSPLCAMSKICVMEYLISYKFLLVSNSTEILSFVSKIITKPIVNSSFAIRNYQHDFNIRPMRGFP